AVPGKLGTVLGNTELLRLDFGIFALHAMLTASFLAIPQMFARTLHLGAGRDWMVYLPVLLVSVAVMVPAIVIAEKRRRMKSVLVGSVIALGLGNLLLFADGGHAPALLVALALFFSGFNVMEATLPSLVTKTAPVEAKGTATGVYSSSQFIGIFFGGVVGGWVHQRFGTPAVFLLSVGVAALWLLVAATMRPPRYLATRTLQVSDLHSRDPEALTARLLAVAGVAEAVLAPEEDAVYLRVDSATYDAAKALAAVQ
ncbi:MAG: MFS transporter, partial [Gammaproteobacteria bacterium]|nr:MFS transporter [Gammaproteobacteria bacterium]